MANFEAFLYLGHFIMHKPLISEEWFSWVKGYANMYQHLYLFYTDVRENKRFILTFSTLFRKRSVETFFRLDTAQQQKAWELLLYMNLGDQIWEGSILTISGFALDKKLQRNASNFEVFLWRFSSSTNSEI